MFWNTVEIKEFGKLLYLVSETILDFRSIGVNGI